MDYYDANAAAEDIADDAKQTRTWAPGSDDNGVLSTKGTLRISGDGTLNVETKYKHGLYAKNRIYMFGGNVGVFNQGRNGIQSKNGFDMSGGTVLLCGVGEHTNKQSRGIIVSGDESEDGAGLGGISISGGVIGIQTTGKAISAKWDIDEDAETDDTSDDPSPVVSVSGGVINIVTTAKVVDSDFSDTVSYYDEDGLPVTEKESCSPEGIEGKLGVDISGGTIAISSTDDALNASRDISGSDRGYVTIRDGLESPRVWLKSSSADAIDSNGDINIEGGVVVAVSSLGSEDGFDCDGALNFRGGLAVGISGSSHVYARETSDNEQNVFVLSSSYAGKPGTSMAIANSAGKAVFAFEIPSDISSYGIMTLSSPELASSDTYSIVSGATLGGGGSFGGLYEEMPDVSGGTSAGTITTSSGTRVYTLGSSGQSQPGGGNPPSDGGTPPSDGGTPPGWSSGGAATETLP
ncbi:MAG: carbohydrate-binding domain-containing protein [Succinivibrionaceae bacterium]|nr:carbohydrate-binding domain-containing protein [Succinivibrionaceae bacterium]